MRPKRFKNLPTEELVRRLMVMREWVKAQRRSVAAAELTEAALRLLEHDTATKPVKHRSE